MGKPVYTDADFMDSMISIPTPTYNEIIDVQLAVLDGADGILLERPTSEGYFQDDVIKAVAEICKEAEAAIWQSQVFSSLLSQALPPIDPTHAISISAVEASLKSSAAAIILATTSGRSAQLVARYRPRCHIIAVTRYGQVARQLNTWRAVLPIHYISPPLPDWNKEVDVRLQMGIELGKEKGLINTGDPIVLLNGWRQGAGFTNTLRVVYASESDPWVYPHDLPAVIGNINVTSSGFSQVQPNVTYDQGTSFSLLSSEIDANYRNKGTSYSDPNRNVDCLTSHHSTDEHNVERPTEIEDSQNIIDLNTTYSRVSNNTGVVNVTQNLGTDQNGVNLNATYSLSGNKNHSLDRSSGHFDKSIHSETNIIPPTNLNVTQDLGPDTRQNNLEGNTTQNLSSGENVPHELNTTY